MMLSEKQKKRIVVVIIVVIAILLLWTIFISPFLSFKKHEKELLNGAKRYYDINSTKLPTGTKIGTVSLKTLYEKEFVDTGANSVYATNKCNIENSFVKVRKENGEYKYYVYLECGLFKSKVDHEGPVIKLKGDDEITINRGDSYKELGVESVKDNTDGVISTKKVKIDSGDLNTSKNGTYQIKYSIKDSFNNETVKIRTVKVIQTINHVVKKESSSGTYKGNNPNGYIMIDQILFRIVKENKDGSVKLVSSNSLAAVDYDGISSWLNDYFYNKLSDSAKKYIQEEKFCEQNVTTPDNYKTCKKYGKKTKVGLLSVDEYNKSKDSNGNYYLLGVNTWLSNKKNSKTAWTPSLLNENNNNYINISVNEIYGVNPVINIKKDSIISSGDGSINNPYYLKGNKKNSKKGDLISTAKTGSYLKYSGYVFRLIGKEEDGTTNVIMTSSVKNTDSMYYTTYDTSASAYNPNRKTNLGYKIVNDVSSYIKTGYFENKKIEVGIYNKNVKYKQYDKVKEYKVKLAAPSIFDLYSQDATSGTTSWCRETINKKNIVYVNPLSGYIYKYNYSETDIYGVRLVGYLKKDIVIKDGEGTLSDPYTLTK